MLDAAPLLALLPAEFSTRDCRGVGLSDKVLARLVRSGRVQPVRRGLFRLPARLAADPHAGDLSRIRAVAAVFAEDHAVSHLSAAALLGLPMPLGAPGPVHLTRLRACHRSRQAPDGVVIHHADSSVTPVVEHLGIRVTAVERTVADCLRTLPLTASVPVVDAVLHRRWATRRSSRTTSRSSAGGRGCRVPDWRCPWPTGGGRPGWSRTRSCGWTGSASPAGAPR